MLKFKCTILLLALVLAPPAILTLHAQNTPPAPIPAQILNAKKVFISNASGDFDYELWSGDPTRTYNEFYAAIKNDTNFQIVRAPGDADVIFQISLHPDTKQGAYLNLNVIDPRTQTILWQIKTTFAGGLQGTRNKNFSSAIEMLAENLKSLAGQSPPAAK